MPRVAWGAHWTLRRSVCQRWLLAPCVRVAAAASPKLALNVSLRVAGAIEEAALILELSTAPEGSWSLEQLDWAGAMAEAVSCLVWGGGWTPGGVAVP